MHIFDSNSINSLTTDQFIKIKELSDLFGKLYIKIVIIQKEIKIKLIQKNRNKNQLKYIENLKV